MTYISAFLAVSWLFINLSIELGLILYWEYYFVEFIEQTTPAMTTVSPPLCIYHRQRALEMMEYDRHIPIPRCDNEGLYEPIQCDRNVKYCWCVNIHNGVELYGTSRTGEMPNCNQKG